MALKRVDVREIYFGNKESNDILLYRKEIDKYPPLTLKEEIALAKKIQKGDKKSLEKLIKHNLKFVRSVANIYLNNGLSYPDIIQEGNIGLYEAAKLYDPDKGIKFISFAVWHIQKHILNAIYKTGASIRLPCNLINSIKKVEKEKQKLELLIGREPTTEEILNSPNITDIDVRNYLDRSKIVSSIDNKITDDGDEIFEKNIKDECSIENKIEEYDNKKTIECLLKNLTNKEKKIIEMSYGIGYVFPFNNDAIAKKFKCSTERIRQIKRKVITELKNNNNISLKKKFF